MPSSKVYEDDDVLAFLDIAPAAKGHTLVIPKNHYETLDEVPDEVLHKIISVVKKVSKAIMSDAQGFNVLQSNKKVAGQFVPHVHFHIIPRHEDDGLTLAHWHSLKYEEGEMQKFQNKLSEAISKNI